MSPDLLTGLRALAEALPPGSPVTVTLPREVLLEFLGPTAVQTSAAPAANAGPGASDEQLLTVREVAERFGVTADWLYRHWQAVGGVKLGRKVLRFPSSALPRYLAARSKAR